ncbi:hypothetical protein [Streptomyces sp. NPDC056160]|uniref:hypothetical protein n=1 Tax=Streptomyces sp. NPDC056160 TaxID=3345731 RepID=UPI0035D88EE7
MAAVRRRYDPRNVFRLDHNVRPTWDGAPTSAPRKPATCRPLARDGRPPPVLRQASVRRGSRQLGRGKWQVYPSG